MNRIDVGDPLDVGAWYPRIKQFTFATCFLSLSYKQCVSICDVYDGKRQLDDCKCLMDLREQLKNVIDEKKGSFCRLETRSGKDWALRAERTTRIFESEMKTLVKTLPNASEDTQKVIAIIRSMSKALRVQSCDEVLEMLTESQRAYQDLTRRVLAVDEKHWNENSMKLVIRLDSLFSGLSVT